MKHVGVVSHFRLPDLPAALKRYALLFDEVQIAGLGADNIGTKRRFLDDQTFNEIEYLYGTKFLTEGKLGQYSIKNLDDTTKIDYVKNTAEMLTAQNFFDNTGKLFDTMEILIQMIKEDQLAGEDTGLLLKTQKALAGLLAKLILEGTSALPLSARRIALDLRLFENISAVCIEELDYRSGEDRPARKADESALCEILIKGLPLPDDAIAWQDILALKSESKLQKQLLNLRVWVADLAKGNLSFGEASDKIEHLKNEYADHMRLARMKYRPGVMKCMVVGTASLIENATKFKLKELADGAFSITERRADLLEAERNAPGRELAYIVNVGNILF